ncbi:MAG: hypothetical protein M3N95_16345 [Actinomycetota bacterium]|nr:hypothetical protein [Actinomycetota bacterium]
MSLTVVTVRDENGAPSARETYAGGSRYRTGNGDLEIMSPNQQILGLYPSGNWLSVYVHDCLRVVPTTPGEFSSESPSPSDTQTELDSPLAGDTETELDNPAAADTEPDPVDRGLAAELEPVAESDAEPGAEPAPAAEVERPLGERGASVGAPTTRPPGMMPVVIRPRTFRPPRGEEDQAPTPSRMMRVVVRPRTITGARSEQSPPPVASRMRIVTVRPRSHQAPSAQAEALDNGESEDRK